MTEDLVQTQPETLQRSSGRRRFRMDRQAQTAILTPEAFSLFPTLSASCYVKVKRQALSAVSLAITPLQAACE
ncbi:hypothetical protein ABBQ32_010590 [Trebouxia sp. C0010 RCD-2024]